jgi:hypothetical protein
MGSFSPSLTFFLDRMQGYSTNIFKLESHSKDTAVAGDVIVFDMPSNAIINLRSFKVFFNANASTATAKGARLPPVHDLFERVEVSVGGIILSQGTNFVNVLTEAKKALEGDHTDVAMGHPEYVRAKSYVNGKPFSGVSNETYNVNGNDPLFCVDRFEGFLGTAEPRLLDTSILPEIRVRITLASNSVLSTVRAVTLGKASGAFSDESATATSSGPGASNSPNTGAAYQLSQIHATIECIGLADQTYDNMIAAMMSQQGFLEIPYKSYDCFQDTHTGSSRFTVSTQSLDRIWVVWRDAHYNDQDTPLIVEGYKTSGAFVGNTNALTAATGVTDIGIPQFDAGGSLNTNKEKYVGRYFNFPEPVAHDDAAESGLGWKAQLQLNGAYYPQFAASLPQLYGITKNSVPGRKIKDMSMRQYQKNYCVQCFRLNLIDSEQQRLLSGLDTRSVNLQGILATQSRGAITNAPNVCIFTESTATLRIGAGRSCEVLN